MNQPRIVSPMSLIIRTISLRGKVGSAADFSPDELMGQELARVEDNLYIGRIVGFESCSDRMIMEDKGATFPLPYVKIKLGNYNLVSGISGGRK
ncbi:MAG: hypothetical protein AABY10_00680 [Nanoarchaeota archaeon]